MEWHSRNKHQGTWDGTNCGTFPKVGEGGQRYRVDGELAVVRNGLDHKDPGVCAAKPATDRAGEADMVARIAIVLRQQLGPARTQMNAFTPNHGRVEISLEYTRACPPDVEIPVASRLEQKEHTDNQTNEHHR